MVSDERTPVDLSLNVGEHVALSLSVLVPSGPRFTADASSVVERFAAMADLWLGGEQ